MRWPTAASPEYHCQLVLVTKLTAVFQAPSVGQRGEAERERQVLLEPAEAEEQQDADQAEAEHRHGVAAPVLVGVRVDPQHAVGHALGGQVLVTGIDVGEVAAQERHGEGQEQHERRDLAQRGQDFTHRAQRFSGRSSTPTSRASPTNAASVIRT